MLGIWFWTFWILTFLMEWQKVQSYTTLFWPQPRSVKLGEKVVTIQPEYDKLNLKGSPQETHSMLKKMTDLAFYHLRAMCGISKYEKGQRKIVIQFDVKSPDMNLTWETIEEYRLDVMDQGEKILSVFISAETVYGARHALETFTQLTLPRKLVTHENCRIRIISSAKIQDEPAYKHRGLLLDTARHFFSVPSIIRTLDGMAASKMNIFHWHITDVQSFPMESLRVPELARYGAFSRKEIYYKEDIEKIVRLAQIRGIRVVLEVDGPAHVHAGWVWGQERYEKKVICCGETVGQLNPVNPNVYEVLRLLYSDIVEYLPKPILFHMGGDEVSMDCWRTNEELANYMNNISFAGNQMTREQEEVPNQEGFLQIWAEFHNKALKVWDEAYKGAGGEKQPVMLWSSQLTNPSYINKYLDPNRFIIELWDRERDAQQLLSMGYRLVLASETWYLDHGFWGDTTYSSWEDMYAHMLPLHPNMMGGEVCMWTEVVNESILDSRIWPRAAAFAERLWSDTDSNGFQETKSRLSRHRARLMARGLHPDFVQRSNL